MSTSTRSHYTKTNLKDRGWTEGMIARFAPEPDELRTNPKYKCAAPMRLYRVKRIARIEKSKKFRAAKAEAKVRKRAAAKSVATKRRKMDEYLTNLVIEVPRIAQAELIDRAQKSFSSMGYSTETTTERMCVNYLRHECSSYEEELVGIAGRVGSAEAYLQVKDAVLDEIALVYPWLAPECSEQSHRAWERFREREEAKLFAL